MNDIIEELKKHFERLKSELISIVPMMALLNTKEWNNLKNRIIKRISPVAKDDTISSYIFIDYVIGVKSTNPDVRNHSKKFVESFNKLAKRIMDESEKSLHQKIEIVFKNLFITGDDDMCGGNSDFKNRLNELLTIDYFNQCDNVQIIEIEKPLINKKTVDIILKHKYGDIIGVEILTLQNIDPFKQQDNESMADFLFGRIKKKYEDKTKGLVKIDDLDNLLILPIVEYADGLETYKFTYDSQLSTPIMCSHLNYNNGDCEMVLSEINQYLENLHTRNV
ncbi:hypothetical protein [Leyella stercorea]|jgi:hypothetical protein|uniref:hypothetical protein n=1 Tax=Leyella stercorea TaxID=363265 RepID=UPI00248AFE99|nr:hypothetical protein [Leyella stercorea]